MAGSDFLQEDSVRPSHDTVKVKLKLQWRAQDVRDARTMGFPLRKASVM